MTGVLRVARESIFSGLNNIAAYTILDDKFSDKFGFTPEDVKWLLDSYGMADRFAEVNDWYNGYRFGEALLGEHQTTRHQDNPLKILKKGAMNMRNIKGGHHNYEYQNK